MKIYYHFDFKGGNAYLGMKQKPVRMGTMVTDMDGLLAALELRLGLHTQVETSNERLVGYYKAVKAYMKSHVDNPLYKSYEALPLAVAYEMLTWRDALAVGGWSKKTPAPSKRMQVLQGVEEFFSKQGMNDIYQRYAAIEEQLKLKKGTMKDVIFVMPGKLEYEHPAIKHIISLAIEAGAADEEPQPAKRTTDNNLFRIEKLLTSKSAETITLKVDDDSFRVWHFKDGMEANEYLSTLPDDTFDVTVNPVTKLGDNFLHMMGKPVAGSSVDNSSPQIVQLFFLAVTLLKHPLDISVLMQWFYSPVNPLPATLRYRLAERLARSGGWCSKDSDEIRQEENCYQTVQKWLAGTVEEEKGEPIDEKEKKHRQNLADIFLPEFESQDDKGVSVARLHKLMRELSAWSTQRAAMALQKRGEEDQLVQQFSQLAELCDTLLQLTDEYQEADYIQYAEIEKHTACLYKPSSFVQYQAQAGSRFVIGKPSQIVAMADRVLWMGLQDYEPEQPDTAFLTPTEQETLAEHILLWNSDSLRKSQSETMLAPIRFCGKQLTLVTIDDTGDEQSGKHPLIVRLEQQIKNYKDFVFTPHLPEKKYLPTTLLDNHVAGIYTNIERTDLIRWKQHESPTSIEELIQFPFDYVLGNIAYISDNGQSDVDDVSRTEGNVAHAVIQKLFCVPDDKGSGYADKIRQRVDAAYKETFNEVVEKRGAILLMEENTIQCRQLFGLLRDCISHLIDIIDQNHLHVTDSELLLEGKTLGTSDYETPSMKGYADMVLADELGHRLIFDLKWTKSKSYHKNLLENNRSSQLAVYASLLEETTHNANTPTAYFLMPEGRLYSTCPFESTHATQLQVKEECEGDIVRQLQASYRYRRAEIMQGKVEMGEGEPLDSIDYYNETREKKFFPLKEDYDDNSLKETNIFSNYTNLKK